ncbi:conserved hypothetical protein [Mesorhizobium escarrei]|uniref:Secreted protein n=1 Tax=Mesorhizobium escarrei TaxID=666018 RepID=A0ABN8JIR7_9HYPH|nr:conserved hypothetical protein [Mesorhizobium escarrei]
MRAISNPLFRLAVVKFNNGMSALSDVLESTLALVVAPPCCLFILCNAGRCHFLSSLCQASIPGRRPKRSVFGLCFKKRP